MRNRYKLRAFGPRTSSREGISFRENTFQLPVFPYFKYLYTHTHTDIHKNKEKKVLREMITFSEETTKAHWEAWAIYLLVSYNHWKQQRLLFSLYKSPVSFNEPFEVNTNSRILAQVNHKEISGVLPPLFNKGQLDQNTQVMSSLFWLCPRI